MEAVLADFDTFLKAFGLTLGLFVVAGIASMLWGTVLAAFRVGPVAILNKFAAVYVTLFRNTPLLMVFVFIAIVAPRLGWTFNVVREVEVAGWNASPFFVRATIALTLYTSAFVCEAMRSGINSVPIGQAEAGRAIGLTFGQSMTQIILPQALRAVIAPLTSVQVALIKNTSVAAAFGIAEATSTMRALTNDHADQRLEIFLLFAIGYVVLVEVVSLSSYALERKVRVA